MKFCIIANPHSGTKKTKKILERLVIPTLNNNKIDFDYYLTEYWQHATNIISNKDLSSYSAILILGGDGTVHEVINGMLNNKSQINLPIGIIPTGSGNSLLFDIYSGEIDCEKSINKIIKFNLKNIDVLKISNRIELQKVDSIFFKKEYFVHRPKSERLVNQNLNKLGLNIMRDWKICLNEYLLKNFSNIKL